MSFAIRPPVHAIAESASSPQYNRLLALMAEEGRKVRPGFQVFSVGWSWNFRGDPDFFPQQAALPAGAGLTMPPDAEAWSFDRKTTDLLIKSRSLTREHGQTFLGYDIFLWGDDTVFGEIKGSHLPRGITKLYDFPLGIAAKLRRWQGLARGRLLRPVGHDGGIRAVRCRRDA